MCWITHVWFCNVEYKTHYVHCTCTGITCRCIIISLAMCIVFLLGIDASILYSGQPNKYCNFIFCITGFSWRRKIYTLTDCGVNKGVIAYYCLQSRLWKTLRLLFVNILRHHILSWISSVHKMYIIWESLYWNWYTDPVPCTCWKVY